MVPTEGANMRATTEQKGDTWFEPCGGVGGRVGGVGGCCCWVLFVGCCSLGGVRWVVFVGWCSLGGVRWVVFVGWCSLGGVRWVVFVGWCSLGGVRWVVFVGWCSLGGVGRLLVVGWCSLGGFGLYWLLLLLLLLWLCCFLFFSFIPCMATSCVRSCKPCTLSTNQMGQCLCTQIKWASACALTPTPNGLTPAMTPGV